MNPKKHEMLMIGAGWKGAAFVGKFARDQSRSTEEGGGPKCISASKEQTVRGASYKIVIPSTTVPRSALRIDPTSLVTSSL